MSTTTKASNNALDPHGEFNALLPKIQGYVRFHFRDYRCSHLREDAIAEAVALSFRWYVRLVERGKKPAVFVITLAKFAVFAVRAGRRLCSQKNKDVLSSTAQRRHGFRVELLPASNMRSYEQIISTVRGQREMDFFEERLHDNCQTPILDQVVFRIDFPVWLQTRTERDRRIISDMAQGEGTFDLAQKYGLSPARISQLRQEFQKDWQLFLDENNEQTRPHVSNAA